ncbi:MAG: acyclic terpene utilization AtuA family protein [Actinomycetota bacterium]|nr:acyclic terpene utilization AtuA family protein [Actinomycetota bacterium]
MPTADGAIRVANCSGFYGDRVAAAREQVEGGPIDYLTGDWLAELTMLILSRNRAKAPATGFAKTFLTQMEQVMGTCLDRGIKVVSNAGGLNPAGCADAVADVAGRLGLSPTIAYVEGDDLMDRLDELAAAGIDLTNMDTGERLADRGVDVLTANAYLGVWGIVEALGRGADIVITGRTTDAAVAAAPAAHHFGWKRDDWDRLAGAIVAGHVIECGAQATGGNYSFFGEVPGIEYVGFPIAELFDDGSCVITKHEGTGGQVSLGTVTSQLLYEVGPPAYANPDVVARFDTIRLEQVGPDRVRISETRGEPAPPTLKVCINYQAGYRNGYTFALTGLDVPEKAALVERQLFAPFPGGRDHFEETEVQLLRTDKDDPATNEEAVALLKITVKDRDPEKIGRRFANAAVEIGLASIPGFFGVSGAPGPAQPFGAYWPALVPAELVPQHVVVRDGERTVVDNTSGDLPGAAIDPLEIPLPAPPTGETRRAPLGLVVGARSGDKGGNANVGLFCRSAEAFAWLDSYLTVERFRELFGDLAHLDVDRYRLANIWSLNFVVHGILDEGVAASNRQDAQAKGLGEYLRARHVDLPVSLLSN